MRLMLVLNFLLLPLSVLLFPHAAAEEHNNRFVNRAVIAFNGYRLARDWELYLRSAEEQKERSKGSSFVHWAEVPRFNPSYMLPTDFIVVQELNWKNSSSVEDNKVFLSALKAEFAVLSEIRSIFADNVWQGGVAVKDEEHRKKGKRRRNEDVETLSKEDIHREYEDRVEERVEEREVSSVRKGRASMRFPLQQQPTKRKTRLAGKSLPVRMNAPVLWDRAKARGSGIRVGVFDTGLREGHPHFDRVASLTDWTGDGRVSDGVGHGTFVAGVIASRSAECPGIAPDAELWVFRVFTDARTSYTSWFLDAFNYALWAGVDILNLSIGGPDHGDSPFVEKIWELTANGAVVVSAAGNDGPLYGTHNNPADQIDVLGVGATDITLQSVASFSSRGTTTWEFPRGAGRAKPDILALGQAVRGSKASGGCRSLSGTSVASPVVAGSVALLLSVAEEAFATAVAERDILLGRKNALSTDVSVRERARILRRSLLNAASIRQVLTATAQPLQNAGILEQGSGVIDLVAAASLLTAELEPLLDLVRTASSESPSKPPGVAVGVPSLFPRAADLVGGCEYGYDAGFGSGDFSGGYWWPHCAQPLYSGSVPIVLNVSVLNPLSVVAHVKNATWHAGTTITADSQTTPSVLRVAVDHARELWPYSGWISIAIDIDPTPESLHVSGIADGIVEVLINTDSSQHPLLSSARTVPFAADPTRATLVGPGLWRLSFPLRVRVIPRPPKSKRLLWDQFHQLRYPTHGYMPRDWLNAGQMTLRRKAQVEAHRIFKNLGIPSVAPGDFRPSSLTAGNADPFDWHGDHPSTNFRDLFLQLRRWGYFLEVSSEPLVCMSRQQLAQYGAVLIVDPEDEFFDAEVSALATAVADPEVATSLLVMSNWYDPTLETKLHFYDENTRSWWRPALDGGANIPAINRMLSPHGIAFGGPVAFGNAIFGLAALSGQTHNVTPSFGGLPSSAGGFSFVSGSTLIRFPAGGYIVRQPAGVLYNQTHQALGTDKTVPLAFPAGAAVAGVFEPGNGNSGHSAKSRGRIVVYGDSTCADSTALSDGNCFELVRELIALATCAAADSDVPASECALGSIRWQASLGLSPASINNSRPFVAPYASDDGSLPQHPPGSTFHRRSQTLAAAAHGGFAPLCIGRERVWLSSNKTRREEQPDWDAAMKGKLHGFWSDLNPGDVQGPGSSSRAAHSSFYKSAGSFRGSAFQRYSEYGFSTGDASPSFASPVASSSKTGFGRDFENRFADLSFDTDGTEAYISVATSAAASFGFVMCLLCLCAGVGAACWTRRQWLRMPRRLRMPSAGSFGWPRTADTDARVPLSPSLRRDQLRAWV